MKDNNKVELLFSTEMPGSSGSVAERSKALVLGTSLIEAWVRIPPLPNTFFYHIESEYIRKKTLII